MNESPAPPQPAHPVQEQARTSQQTDIVNEVSDLFGDMFLDDSYSIESLLTKAQEHNLTLNQLREQLIRHQQDLNQTSLELFNNSYDRFYKLSHIIACLGEPIQHVINPLQNYRNHLGELCENHDLYLNEINKKLALLEETSRNKYLTGKLITLIKRRERIFQQIHRIEWLKRPSIESIISEPVDNIEHKVNCDAIERICVELHHLECCLSAIQPTSDELIPIKTSLQSSLKQQQSLLGAWFYDVFRLAIEAQNKPIIEFVLRTYKQIGLNSNSELDRVWRHVIVKPYLDLTISSDSKLLANMRQTYDLLGQFLQKHVDLIDADLVVSSFWLEVVEALEKLQRLYSPSEGLDIFRERYLLTEEFLNLYKPADGQPQLDMQRIMARFDLEAYFGQRSAKIRAHLEAGLAQQPLSELPSRDANEFKLKISRHMHDLIVGCWSPEVYIAALDEKFREFCCQLLARYADWLGGLRLSDFRIVGAASGQPIQNDQQAARRTTDFLSKQDAIMRLLIDDCQRLEESIGRFERSRLGASNVSILSSFVGVRAGLNNVRNLQQLLER